MGGGIWEDTILALQHHHNISNSLKQLEGLETDFPSYHRSAKGAVWTTLALNAPDQLRQRMAWALAQVFVVSESGLDNPAQGWKGMDVRAYGSRKFTPMCARARRMHAHQSLHPPSATTAVEHWVNFYDILVRHAFGSFRELVREGACV